jgi:uncharacterized protein (DUF433 family)
MAYDRISIDYAKMGGLPSIRDLRIPVSTVVGQLAAGRTHAEILADFPDLDEADIVAALECAAAAVQERELPLAAQGFRVGQAPTGRVR